MRILRENTVALVIDVQEKLFPHITEKEKLEKNLRILISGLSIFNIPLVITEQYSKGLGSTISSIQTSLGSCPVLEKTSFSCCDDENFMQVLQKRKPVHVLVAGIESHICVLQTSVDLLHQGFIPVVIEDCVSSRKLNDKIIAMERMRSEGVVISTYESILFELLRHSGTDEFKAISKLLK